MSQQMQKLWSMDELRTYRDEILAVAERNGAFNVRVFGSVARGDSDSSSDVDFLVSFIPGSSIFDQVGLWMDLRDLLGCEVDLLTDHPDAGPVTEAAREEAARL